MTPITRRQAGLAAAGAGALALAGLSPAQAQMQAGPPASPRERLSLDFGWRFHLGHAQDVGRDFGFGADQRTYAKAGHKIAGPAEADFDDAGWRALDLPHDWAVELPFVPSDWKPEGKPDEGDPRAAHGYKPLGREFPDTSVGWYRKVFDLPAADAGKRLSIEFDGVFRDAVVMFNGYIVAHAESGYSPFRVDVTDFANLGGRNVLAVRVDASLGEGWFYEGAGVYRHVWLTKTDPVHVPQWGVTVRGGTDGAVTVAVEVANESDAAGRIEVAGHVLNAAGKPVLALPPAPLEVAAWGEGAAAQAGRIASPRLWSIEDPHLYTLVTELTRDGRLVDRVSTTFGLRDIRFDAARGFFLNGKPVKLKGTCNHQDHAGVGAAIPDRLQAWRLEQLKAMGCNAYRASHNPPTPELLDLCDRMGILVIDETRRMSSDAESLDELARLVRRDRNHPSVILWSIGNEEPQQGTARGLRVARSMKRLVNRLDPTRPVTAAMDQAFGEGITAALDVIGFNYRHDKMDAFHAAHPDLPIIGTESASTVSTRGEYRRDDAKGYVPAYDVEHPWWATTAETWWTHAAERPWMGGGFIWTGFDYRGEPTPFNRWPNVSSQFGVLDTCGFPKDNFFYYRAWWRPEPSLHLLPHWTWPGEEGRPIPVWVHSNLDEVELFLNGASQGRRRVERNRHVEWQVPYRPGVIEAVGYAGGRPVLRERRTTAGPAAAVTLSADRTRLTADGRDVAMIAASLVDARGTLIPKGDLPVTFEIAGPAQVIGVGNGDPTSHEPDKASARKAFNGLCQAIIQTRRGQPGQVVVRASAPGVKPATLSLTAAAGVLEKIA